jgi:hypothetical protein
MHQKLCEPDTKTDSPTGCMTRSSAPTAALTVSWLDTSAEPRPRQGGMEARHNNPLSAGADAAPPAATSVSAALTGLRSRVWTDSCCRAPNTVA